MQSEGLQAWTTLFCVDKSSQCHTYSWIRIISRHIIFYNYHSVFSSYSFKKTDFPPNQGTEQFRADSPVEGVCRLYKVCVSLVELVDTVSGGVFGQVELVLLLQGGWNKASPQEVIATSELGSGLFGGGEGNEHVRLDSVWTALLHVPAFQTKTEKKRGKTDHF